MFTDPGIIGISANLYLVVDAARQLIKEDRFIALIKAIRNRYNASLKDSKEWAEDVRDGVDTETLIEGLHRLKELYGHKTGEEKSNYDIGYSQPYAPTANPLTTIQVDELIWALEGDNPSVVKDLILTLKKGKENGNRLITLIGTKGGQQ